MNLKVLEAKNGDSLLISGAFDGKQRNLLIDGGPKAAYGRRKLKGDLYRTLSEIKGRGERVDLLVLTHVDDDHIGGLLEGFKRDELLAELVDKVWFNSGRSIHQVFGQAEDASKLVEFDSARTGTDADNQTSIGQGVQFEDFITERGIWNEQIIEAGQVHDFYGANITILSPRRPDLEKLLGKWTREAPDSLTSANKRDYGLSFDELLEQDEFTGDSAPHNGSSIAILFEYDESSLLLLADAHDDVVQASIRVLKDKAGNLYSEENPLEVDYVKISHHGSECNTSLDFLRLIKSNNFIITTDGSRHGFPNKRTLARIAECHAGSGFWFNYPYLIEQILSKEELANLKSQGYKFGGCNLFAL